MSDFQGFSASVLENSRGNGEIPGSVRNASRADGSGPLFAGSKGSRPGSGPTVGRGKDIVEARVGSSGCVPNSSKRSIFCVNGRAPNNGLGLLSVGTLYFPPLSSSSSGMEPVTPWSAAVPVGPPSRAPLYTGGRLLRSSASDSLTIGPVQAD